jgi:regulator of sirC expression with transglutaminase-like and TPR domain
LDTGWSSHRAGARRKLAGLLSAERFDVVEAALWVAAEEYPELDVQDELRRLRDLCADGARRVRPLHNPFARLDGLRAYLFEELGFRGNLDDYDDPRNSFLNDVRERRLGIPLTLSMLFMEQARAADFAAIGVGLPGHFVVRVAYAGRDILVDPFHGGRVITEEDCQQLVARSTGRASLFRREHLEGTSERAMLARLLLNLKHIYLGNADYDSALSVVERLLLVSPNDSNELRDRGFLKAHLGRPSAAIADLEAYLALVPNAPDSKSVAGRLLWLRRRVSQTN